MEEGGVEWDGMGWSGMELSGMGWDRDGVGWRGGMGWGYNGVEMGLRAPRMWGMGMEGGRGCRDGVGRTTVGWGDGWGEQNGAGMWLGTPGVQERH